ncbi:MAG: hypothetical protein ACLRQC_13035 [Dorea formicigenerans]
MTKKKDWIRGSIESYSVDKLDQCINQMYSNYIIQDDQDCSVCYDGRGTGKLFL